jgi:MFS family permease
VICLIIFYGLFTSALACYSTVAIEFNQHLAGAIFGLINTLGTFAGFLGPLTAGYMLTGSGGNWLIPFFVDTAIAAVSAMILLTVPIRPIKVEGVAPAAVPVGGIVH